MMHSKKHILIYALLIIVLAGLQEAFFNHLRILGAKPNLTLVAVCIIAVRMTRTEAMVLGFLAGLYVDIVYSRYVGLYALLYMVICVILAIATSQDFKRTVWWPVVTGVPAFFVFTMAESFIIRLIAMYVVDSPYLYENYWTHITSRILPEVLYDFIALAVLFVPLHWIMGKVRVKDEQMNY